VATTMSTLFVALFALIAPVFEAALPCRRRYSRFATNLRFAKGTRRVACASADATGSCGLCCTDSGPVGGDLCRWFSLTRSSVGTAGLSPGIGFTPDTHFASSLWMLNPLSPPWK
jgi:hypothetical protein